jgi:hypothetical protein
LLFAICNHYCPVKNLSIIKNLLGSYFVNYDKAEVEVVVIKNGEKKRISGLIMDLPEPFKEAVEYVITLKDSIALVKTNKPWTFNTSSQNPPEGKPMFPPK